MKVLFRIAQATHQNNLIPTEETGKVLTSNTFESFSQDLC